jgi:hypothetical protein
VNSFQNSQCKYSDSIGQEPCHAKSRHVCAKGIRADLQLIHLCVCLVLPFLAVQASLPTPSRTSEPSEAQHS